MSLNKRNDGGDGRPWSEAAQSWATAPATLTEKRAMKKEEEVQFFFLVFKGGGLINVYPYQLVDRSKNSSRKDGISHKIGITNMNSVEKTWVAAICSVASLLTEDHC